MADSRYCAAVQEKHRAHLMVRDAYDDRKQQLTMTTLAERANILQTVRSLRRKEITLKHIVGCCISKYTERFPCIRAEPTHSIRQVRRKVLDAINIEQSRFHGRKATMVRPRLAENRMHPALLNRLTYSFKVPKSPFAPVVPNQQPWHCMG